MDATSTFNNYPEDLQIVNGREELPLPEVVTISVAQDDSLNQAKDPLPYDPLCVKKSLDFRPVVKKEEEENEKEVIIKSDEWSDEWSSLTFHETWRPSDLVGNNGTEKRKSAASSISLRSPVISRNGGVCPAPTDNDTNNRCIEQAATETGSQNYIRETKTPENAANVEENRQRVNALRNVRFARKRTAPSGKIDCANGNPPQKETGTKSKLVPGHDVCKPVVVTVARDKELERLACELARKASPTSSGKDAEEKDVNIPNVNSENIGLHETRVITDDACNEKIPPVRLRKVNETGNWETASNSDESDDMSNSEIVNQIGEPLAKYWGILEDENLQNLHETGKKNPSKKQNTNVLVNKDRLNETTKTAEKLSSEVREQVGESEKNAVVQTFHPMDEKGRLKTKDKEVLGTGPKLNEASVILEKVTLQVEEPQVGVIEKMVNGNGEGEKTDNSARSLSPDRNKNTQCVSSGPVQCADCHASFQTTLSWRGHRPKCKVRILKAKKAALSFQANCKSSRIRALRESSHIESGQVKKDIVLSRGKLGHVGYDRLRRPKPNRVVDCLNSSDKKSTHIEKNLTAVKYSCRECGKILRSKSLLVKHRAMHASTVPYWCHFCGKGFPIRGRLLTHLRIHSGIRPFGCGVCGKYYTTRDAMRFHKRKNRHHCTEDTDYVQTSEINKQTSREMGMFPCDLCEHTTFSTSEELSLHEAIHTQPPLDLGVVGSVVNSSMLRTKKQKSRVEEGEALCLNFTSPTDISKNMIAFTCGICGKEFPTNLNLGQHYSYHRGDSPYQCDSCETAYRTADGLRHHHQKVVHGNKITFNCNSCSKSFTTRFKLNKHVCLQTRTQLPNILHKKEFPTSQGSYKGHIPQSSQNSHQTLSGMTQHNLKKRQCTICGKILASNYNLKTHMFMHLGQKPYECQKCEKQFVDFYRCKAHERVCTYKKGFTCDICDRTFSVAEKLKYHKKLHRKEHEFTHDLFMKVFPSQQYLDDNESSDIRRKSFPCKTCKRSFASSDDWRAHSLIHINNMFPTLQANAFPETNSRKKFPSSVSGVILDTKNAHRIHMYSDARKPYQCEICDKQFQSNCRLEDHIRMHNNERPFHCSECPKTYFSREVLHKHKLHVHLKGNVKVLRKCQPMHSKKNVNVLRKQKCMDSKGKMNVLRNELIHTKENLIMSAFTSVNKKYKCNECSKSFSWRSGLNKHKRENHCKTQYSCPQCGKSFASSIGLNNHIVTHNAIMSLFHCHMCPFTVLSAKALQDHMHSHEVAQSLHTGFSKAHTVESNLRTYKSVTNVKTKSHKYKCNQCKKSFTYISSLTRHKLVHTGEKPFVCKLCDAAFRESYKLKLHMIQHATSGNI